MSHYGGRNIGAARRVCGARYFAAYVAYRDNVGRTDTAEPEAGSTDDER